jgi:dsRNA-specific ribonuclease
MQAKSIGHAGLVGWRQKVGNKTAEAVSKRTRLKADTVRAVLGGVFLALSLKTTAEMVARLTRALRGANVRS